VIVLDNSVFMAALFDDEQLHAALILYGAVLSGEEDACVPPIFLYEACNAVVQSKRRGRISDKAASDYFSRVYDFPAQVDTAQEMPVVVELSTKYDLTVYDASYLELCKRKRVPLATLDKALTAAAVKEKAALIF